MDASAVEEEIMNMMTICRRAACSTEEPPRMAPVIMPGIAMMPITLRGGWRGWGEKQGEQARRCGAESGRCGPHLVDVGREREPEGVARDGLAGFEAGGPEGEVHLNFVSVFAECVQPEK